MKGLKLGAKISVVATSLLTGILAVGTVIAGENVDQICKFLGQSRFKKVETEGGDEEDTEYYKSEYNNIAELIEDGRKAAQKVEAEGATLLKNKDNTLPLKDGAKVSLLSYNAYDPAYGGRGSAQPGGQTEPAITPVQGFKQAGFDVNETVLKFYADNVAEFAPLGKGGALNDASWDRHMADANVKNSILKYNDAAFYVVNRVGGEGQDLPIEQLRLSENERSVLKGLKGLKDEGKLGKIIVLLDISNAIELDFLDDEAYGIDACLWIGNPGINGFAAVGDICAGKVNPSGHLSDTYWEDLDANPVSKNFGAFEYKEYNTYNLPNHLKYKSQVTYQEGIYLGYRYAETRYADKVAGRAKVGDYNYDDVIARPFGYGESFTDFEWSNFKLNKVEDATLTENVYEVSVDVKNVGEMAGKDAVQIYVQKPYTKYDIDNQIEKSAIDLVGFAKTKLIEPGKTETVTVRVNERDLTSYDATTAKTYILDAGDYYFTAAKDSHNAINNILYAQNNTNGIIGEGTKDLTGKVALEFDKVTYSTTKNTKEEITNLFDKADINKYEGFKDQNSVKYLTRNDWEGTFPKETVSLKMTRGLQKDLLRQDNLKSIKKSDTPYPTMGNNVGISLINLLKDSEGNPIDYDDPIWDTFLDQLTWDELETLVSNGYRMTAGIESVSKPQTVDHNGPAGLTESYGNNKDGLAARTNDKDKNKRAPYYPSAGIISASFDHEIAGLFGKMLGEDAIWAGYAGFYGVGINTHRSPNSGRNFEYFSEDPYLGGVIAAEETIQLQKRGCNAYIKHFALNDQEKNRGGIGVWANEQTLREIYLKPFQIAVEDGGAMHAMAAFVRIGSEYCPASKALITDFLKDECGLRGLVVTDMYDSIYTKENWPNFLMAGTDIPDGTLAAKHPFEGFKKEYGHVAQKMRESAKRICYSTLHSNAMNGYSSSTKLVQITPKWQVALYAVDGVVGTLFAASLVLAGYVIIKSLKKTK